MPSAPPFPAEEVQLPREELIGWISKQLSTGIRSINPGSSNEDVETMRSQLTETNRLKKQILKKSKLISNLINSGIAEEWRYIELENQKRMCERRNRELHAALNFVHDDHIDVVSDLQSKITTKWTEIEKRFSDDSLARKSEDSLLDSDLLAMKKFSALISTKRLAALDESLHEQFLLKQQKEKRLVQERALKEMAAKLSSELHATRDLERVQRDRKEEQSAVRDEKIEAEHRQLEWNLMEEEIRLTRELKILREGSHVRQEKLRSQITQINTIYCAEKSFVDDQARMIKVFKDEISRLRLVIRDLETTISRFKSYLRHAEKSRRVEEAVGT